MTSVPTGARPHGVRLLRRQVRARPSAVITLSVLLLVSTVLAVVSPQILGRFVDGVGRGDTTEGLVRVAAVFLVVAVLAELCWVAADCLGAQVAWSATNDLRADLVQHCFGLDLSFYRQHTPGELIDRIDGDVGRLGNYFSQLFLLVVANMLLLVGIGVALFVRDWRVGLCYIPFVFGSVLLLRRLLGVAIPAGMAQREANAQLMGFLEERLGGLEDLRANGARSYVLQTFWLKAAGLLTAARRAAGYAVRWPAAAQGLASLGLVLALVAGIALHRRGDLSLGAVYVLVAYAGMLQAPLMVIVFQMRDLEDALAALRRVGQLFAERSSLEDGTAEPPPRATVEGRALAMEGVRFSYREGEPDAFALADVSWTVAPGRRVAIVGRTGSGKSTLVRLLSRLADPDAGRVLLDGHDLRGYRLGSLRGEIGVVTQDVQIFPGTVRENVTLFDETVPAATVERALREAHLGTWLDALPDGIDSPIRAGGLSAGEAQLLSFARVLVTDPGVVLLDEASARLDPASRHLFRDVLDRLLAGRTVVMVAHQLDMLGIVDDVIVMSSGRVVEQGPVDSLTADPDSVLSALLRAEEVPA